MAGKGSSSLPRWQAANLVSVIAHCCSILFLVVVFENNPEIVCICRSFSPHH